jgi:hypothetical protein
MTELDLPYVNPQRDRNGRIRYWYFRRVGRRWRLPGDPLSELFMAEYRRLLAATTPSAPGGADGEGAWVVWSLGGRLSGVA